MLQTDGKADIAGRDAGLLLLLRRELRMRRGGWVDSEAAGVTNIGDVVEEAERVDKAPAGVSVVDAAE